MKSAIYVTVAIFAFSILLLSMKPGEKDFPENKLNGAWVADVYGSNFILLFADEYCTFTQYNLEGKQFILTSGGPFTVEKDLIRVNIQFSSSNKEEVGKTQEYGYKFSGNELITSINNFEITWKRIDEGNANLAGNWRIVQRRQDGQLSDMPLRARRTLKLLTSTRFQWMAINIETGEFSGTGGGTYTFKDGIYKENIEFFSRDSTRVGMSLSFDDKLEHDKWIHSGKSSKGDPIYEIWGRLQQEKE